MPLSGLYGLAVWIRNKLFDTGILQQKKFPVCIVVVGNLSLGGTGKTPHVIALAKLLRQNYELAILTRGYKRESKGFRWVQSNDDVRLTGDEALEMKTSLGDIPIACDGNRRRGIEQILKEANPRPQIILMDDGFQHRSVKPDFSLLLTRLNSLYSKDLLLPAGRLRESKKGAKRAQAICVTGNTSRVHTKQLRQELNTRAEQILLTSKPLYRLISETIPDNNTELLLLSSIAEPKAIISYLNTICKKVHHLKFKDHHKYREHDIQKIIRTFSSLTSAKKLLITTGKDLVKLRQFEAFMKVPHACLEIDIEFNEGGQDKLIKEITSYVRQN